jgi:general secretion pathway protein D
MKHVTILTLLALFATGQALFAAEASPGSNPKPDSDPGSTNALKVTLPAQPPESSPAQAPDEDSSATNSVQAASPAANPGDVASPALASDGSEGLRLNFHNAPLEQVLNYMSEAAGFIIVLEAQPKGRVDVYANQPLTREEAADLLDSVLKRNGFAAVHDGRKLTIVNRDEIKTRGIPVRLGGDPESIPRNDEVVTQIIPVRFVEAGQLIKDLQPLVSTINTTMTANESGNSIIITDTQANIHKVAEVIKAIDSGAEDMTLVKVFRLKYADPSETSDLLSSLFPDDTRNGGGNQAPIQFGGGFRRFFGGGGGGGQGGGGNAANNSQNQRLQKRHRVIAVAEPRTSSVVVSAARDLMEQIEGVVQELDANPARKQTVHVFRLDNAEPSQAMQVLQDIFQKSGTQNTRNTTLQNNPLLTRSTTQGQQSTSGTRSTLTPNNRGGGIGGFGQ